MSEFKSMTDSLPAFDRLSFQRARLKIMVMLGQKAELDEYVKKHRIPTPLKETLSNLASVYNNKEIITLLNEKESKKEKRRNKK